MKTALVIGKFSPLHTGHMALIAFAKKQCDQLILLLGAGPGDTIPGPLRFQWLQDLYGKDADIRLTYTDEDLPDAPQSDRRVSRVWADYLKKRFPETDSIISSEKYGEYLAEYMGIKHIPFDTSRSQVPISATQIRQEPVQNWKYISPPARAAFQKTVCVYGPESTGKTTLSRLLAEYYDCKWVPEMAREYLGDRMVVEDDFLPIAELHARAIMKSRGKGGPLLFVDTDHLTTQIYARYYCDFSLDLDEWIVQANSYDLYLFTDIDVPWVADIQRHSPHMREIHKRWFLAALEKNHLQAEIISGDWDERWRRARASVDRLRDTNPFV